MSTSRRNFLKTGSMVALAAGVPVALAGRVPGAEALADVPPTFGLRKADFENALNTEFRINLNRSKICVKLVDVKGLNSPRRGGEAFSLMFRGDASQQLEQNTYVIEHERLGVFSFLLVPMREGKSGQRYEAVINRLHA